MYCQGSRSEKCHHYFLFEEPLYESYFSTLMFYPTQDSCNGYNGEFQVKLLYILQFKLLYIIHLFIYLYGYFGDRSFYF